MLSPSPQRCHLGQKCVLKASSSLLPQLKQPFPLSGLTTVLPLDGLQGRVRRQWPKAPSVEVLRKACVHGMRTD